jgi:cytochrome c oxidase cbb3-type subunit I/II
MSTNETTTIVYNDKIARQFIWASVLFGIVGMLLGVIVALQLAWWPANWTQYFSFGRLRPLHTNAVIFAFVGNMIFAGIYYSSQRLLKVRLPSDKLGAVHFWGWQLIIVAAVATLPLGITQGKEYAELEWPIDIAIAGVWLVFAYNFFWMLKRRNEKQLYVALWFYIASIVTITVLHVVNSLAIPVGLMHSYSVFAGVQDALVQWWYGHNAVAFFLTTPVLGIMYYFVPKAADRPVFSYRLSIIHFWALVFLYIWAGPHHLLNTALPDWAQTLGMIFSLMLWAPSWGGMLNGLLTLRGAWDKLRKDPVLKFFAAGLTFYGMATFEGPLLSIKAVSSLAHYTDWIIGHVHAGALGWNGFMAAGMFYFLIPKLYGTKLYSREAANLHFYLGTFGILLYVVAMWVAGITQGLMWRAELPEGGLQYSNFIETLVELRFMYWMRMVGGIMYLIGFIIMAWNLVMTVTTGKAVDGSTEITRVGFEPEKDRKSWKALAMGQPIQVSVVILLVAVIAGISTDLASVSMLLVLFCAGFLAILFQTLKEGKPGPTWHHLVEGRAMFFTGLVIVSVLVGGIAEIIPSIISGPRALRSDTNVPYTALELEGRDIYIAEGCYNCHSQMIRPFTWEVARYGDVSTPEESVFDHPFQWGSKRTGPDLARVGPKYEAAWHYEHMMDPRESSPGSNMPPYPHLFTETIDFSGTEAKLRGMSRVGVPYTIKEIQTADMSAMTQAEEIAAEIKEKVNVTMAPNTKLIALIAYLRRLGNPPEPPAAEAPVEGETTALNQETN